MEHSLPRHSEREAESGTEAASGAAGCTGRRLPGPLQAPQAAGPLHRIAEQLAIAAVAGSCLGAAVRLAGSIRCPSELLVAGMALPLALALADGISGLVHWAADRLLPVHWPVLGAVFVQPFHDHHRDPLGITRRGFVDLNGNNCLLSWPLGFWAFALSGDPSPGVSGVFASALLLQLTSALALTNQIHQWAHAAAAPRFVRALQRAGLVLSRGHHLVHHAPPHDRHFCITTGWVDGLLDTVLGRSRTRPPRRVGMV